MKPYDICVIGAGSAGLVAATTANRLGARTVLVEKNKIGGECLHSGCVPSKAFVHAARTYKQAKEAEKIGLPALRDKKLPDLAPLMEHIQNIINSIYAQENADVYRGMGIDVLFGAPTFRSAEEIALDDQTITARHFIICSGSAPQFPPIPGLEPSRCLTNENFWDLRKLPETILFLGAGPISVELGQALARLGSRVYLIFRTERILKKEDPEIAVALQDILAREGVGILDQTQIKRMAKKGDNYLLTLERGGQETVLAADAVFVATGRQPNLATLQLENAKVAYGKQGIGVDDYLQTSAANIYACGDVIGRHLFTHAAAFHAETAVRNILQERKTKISEKVMPWVTFSDPEAAHVGLTESEAREKYSAVKILKTRCNLDRFLVEGQDQGFLKIILNDEDEICGAHALGAHSGEFIQQITLAMQNKLGVREIAGTISPYPTFSEIVKKTFSRYLRSLG